jgi:signal transduction histidine kinase
MSEFLTQLDQWALGILMGICTLFGVQELPEVPDPHWKVEERWVQQPDGYHQLVISSETIQEECRSGRAKYVIFPQSYMARQQIFADSMRVYTNEMDREWYLKSFLNKPAVGCDLLKHAKTIKLEILSYEKYFTSIGAWPHSNSSYPKLQWGYTLSYAIVGVLSAVCGLLFFVIGLFVGEKSYNILFLSSAIFLLMFSHYSEFFLVTHIHISHQIAMVSLLMISYVVIFEKHFFDYSFWSYLLFSTLVLMEVATSYSHAHLTQLYIVINATVALFIILYLAAKKERNTGKRIILGVAALFGFKDLYESQIEREGFLHLSLLCVVLIVFMSYQLILKIYEKNLKHQIEKESILNDKKMIEKIREVNYKIKQVLHDMKSPITSLNFILSSESVSREKLQIPIKRLNDLVQDTFGKNTDYMADWYSVNILSNCISLVIEEKSYIKNVPELQLNINNSALAFFDPELVKSLVAELIDNSIKNNDESILISMILKASKNGTIELFYSDTGVGLKSKEIRTMGLLGYSRTGTGIGLNSLINRLTAMGGSFSISEDPALGGFCCCVSFLAKSSG